MLFVRSSSSLKTRNLQNVTVGTESADACGPQARGGTRPDPPTTDLALLRSLNFGDTAEP
jgi:hypothetical protein